MKKSRPIAGAVAILGTAAAFAFCTYVSVDSAIQYRGMKREIQLTRKEAQENRGGIAELIARRKQYRQELLLSTPIIGEVDSELEEVIAQVERLTREGREIEIEMLDQVIAMRKNYGIELQRLSCQQRNSLPYYERDCRIAFAANLLLNGVLLGYVAITTKVKN